VSGAVAEEREHSLHFSDVRFGDKALDFGGICHLLMRVVLVAKIPVVGFS